MIIGCMACEIEGQFAADDQFFEKFIGDNLLAVRVLADCQRNFYGRDVTEMQVRTEIGSRMGRRLVFVFSVAAQALTQEHLQVSLRLGGAAPKRGGWLHVVIDVTRGDQTTYVFSLNIDMPRRNR